MNNSQSKKGFSTIEVIIVIVVVAIVGLLGYVAYDAFSRNNTNSSDVKDVVTTESSVATDVPAAEPATITSTKDIDTINALLDEINLDESNTDATALDSEASNF